MSAEEPSDDFLENCIGRWGIWQCSIVFFIFLCKIPMAFQQLNIVFLTAPTTITCLNKEPLCSPKCDQYVYDRSVFKETLITQFNLFCDRKYLATLAQTLAMVGTLIGNITWGTFGDKFGRKWPFIWAVMLASIFGAASAFPTSYALFLFLRFLSSMSTGGTMNTSFVMIIECIGKKYRTLLGILYQIPFSTGYALLSLIAYYERDWRWYLFWQSIVPSILIVYVCVLPEAPRWLLAVGRNEEAIKILEKAAKLNGRPVEKVKPIVDAAYKPSTDGDKSSAGSFSALLRSKILMIRTACIAYNWFVCGFTYYGVSQYLNKLSGNIFLNVAVAGFVQIPGTILTAYCLEKFGRKYTLIATNTVAFFTIFILGFIPKELMWTQTCLASISVSAMMMSFANVYVFAGELFPTVLRSSGVGFCSMSARIGAILAPFIPDLSETATWLPCVIFSVVAIIGAILCWFLPETKGITLPDTIEDALNIGKH